MNKSVKIAIFGSYSGYNKGDLAILISIIKNMSQRSREIIFLVPSKNPNVIKKALSGLEQDKVNIYKTITSYWGFQTIKCLRTSDILIFGGGGLFFEHKPFNFFYNHLVNLFTLTLVNRLFFKKPIYIFSVGSSHLKSKIMISLTKYILNNSSYITARDYHTANLFSRYSHRDVGLYYDPVFLIDGNSKISSYIENFINELSDNSKIIIILNESFLNQINNNSKMQEVVNVVNKLQKEYEVVLTYNTTVSKHIKKLYSLCEKKNLVIFHPHDAKPEEIIYFYSIFDYAICVPMHAAIFAYNAGTRMITIEFDNKMIEFNKIIGNKNTVSVYDLGKISLFLDNYHEIDWDAKSRIRYNALENFIKMKEIINEIEASKRETIT